ncbi:hypothetical protein, partial [Burkholderia gladioli]|uniref:hypothetical protein n=1 Tax=Burkholderia gladioli TaxID=28095 RepID=UPI001E582CD4
MGKLGASVVKPAVKAAEPGSPGRTAAPAAGDGGDAGLGRLHGRFDPNHPRPTRIHTAAGPPGLIILAPLWPAADAASPELAILALGGLQ